MEKLNPIRFDEPETQLSLLRNCDREYDWRLVGLALNRRFSYAASSSLVCVTHVLISFTFSSCS
jgi:hypothetical protein